MEVERVVFLQNPADDDSADIVYHPTSQGCQFEVYCAGRPMRGDSITLDHISKLDAEAVAAHDYSPLAGIIAWDSDSPDLNRICDPERHHVWLKVDNSTMVLADNGVVREVPKETQSPEQDISAQEHRKPNNRTYLRGILQLLHIIN